MQNENRESFVFYRSFLGAIQEMEQADQLAMFWAICNYALTGEEPALQSAIQRAVFAVIRPSIDTTQRSTVRKAWRTPQNANRKNHTSKCRNHRF